MSDKKLRTLVNGLVEGVTAENVVSNGLDDTLPGPMFSSTIPGGLTTEEQYVRQPLALYGEAAVAFYECLYYMEEQSERGFLEHLAQRDVQQRLWQFVSESWVDR